MGEIETKVSEIDTHTLQLKFSNAGLRFDRNAPTMPWNGGGVLSLGAEALTGVSAPDNGTVRLRVVLNDTSLKGLQKPTVRTEQNQQIFVDDGTDPSDTAGDNIWLGWIDVPRQERVRLIFENKSLGLGFVDVALPATPAATVNIYRLASGLSRFSTQLREVDKTVLQATPVMGMAPRGDSGEPLVGLQIVLDMRDEKEVDNPRVVYQDQKLPLYDDERFGGIADDGIYQTNINVAQSNVAELAIWSGQKEIGKATIFLPETGRAEVKALANDGLHAWVEQRISTLPQVTFANEYTDTRALTTEDKEQELDIFFNEAHGADSIRVSTASQVLGVYPISGNTVQVRIPRQEKVRIEILSKGQEKGGCWVIPLNGLRLFLGLRYKDNLLSVQDKLQIGSEWYTQRSPLVVEATSKSEGDFVGKTLLSVRLDDPLQEISSVEINDTWSLERSPKGGFEGSQFFAHSEFVLLDIKSSNRLLSSVVVFLPKAANASIGLTHTRVGLQNSDMSEIVSEEPLVFEATKEGTEGLSDKITVLLLVDDRVLGRLQSPIIRLAEAGREPILLKDDGEESDTKAFDQIYTASFVVSRAEYLQVVIEDKGKLFGEMTAFLPSSSEAKINLRTVDATNGIKLLTEAQALQGVDSTALGVSTEESNVSETKLVHILWVMIILFSVFFVYVRSVIYRTWTDEVFPILRRLEKKLDETNHD